MKEQLQKYLEAFKTIHNMSNPESPILEIKLFSGIKRRGYNMPMIHIGKTDLNKMAKNEEWNMRPAWFVEIWIDDLCVWRKSRIADDEVTDFDCSQFESQLINETIQEIINYGMISSWNILKSHIETNRI